MYFFHYPLVPLYPPPPSNHHTVVHVHESSFLFAQSLHPPPYRFISMPVAALTSYGEVASAFKVHLWSGNNSGNSNRAFVIHAKWRPQRDLSGNHGCKHGYENHRRCTDVSDDGHSYIPLQCSKRQVQRPFWLPCWRVSGVRPVLACPPGIHLERILCSVVAQAT